MSSYCPELRNFSIIAHIDHGKSSLADRLLELTGTISKEKMKPQFLDMMDLEREKGITIKMQPCRMIYRPSQELEIANSEYVLNLIDTPGHVDFSYEVSRSLAAVEGAILLVDAIKGIQAQTLANLDLAQKQNLTIIPAINKIDLVKNEDEIEKVFQELADLLKIDKKEILKISAKHNIGIEDVLKAVIKRISPPKTEFEKPFRALIFDSKYDPYKGVVAFVRVFDGKIKNGEKIYLMANKTSGEVKELGYFVPDFFPQKELKAGEIGFLATGIKEPGKVRVGDTITNFQFSISNFQSKVEPLEGYQEPKPMVFASIYPQDPENYDLLKVSLTKLKLNDPALIFETEKKEFLGRGFRCGFLGNLHAEIVNERLKREFNLELIISAPSVVYKIIDKKDKEIDIFSVSEWLEFSQIKEIREPWAKLEILSPIKYLGPVSEILSGLQGKFLETQYFGIEKTLLVYEVPLRKIISGFYDELKEVSKGYASMGYSVLGYRPADLVKIDILIAGKKQENFSQIVERNKIYQDGKNLVQKLKEILPSQLFAVPIQAVFSGKIIARETISAKRRDVIAPLYGGDYTRKRKLLEKQKLGKQKLEKRGQLKIPSEVFLRIFKNK